MGVPILTSSAANLIQDSRNWSLSWYPDGRSDSFTREAILACAPPASGVYGLFNGDCQVFIGESANIQEALLRHESETEFHSRHLQPTGFTFEPCPEEVRKSKAAALIAKYRPVLQTEAALTEPYLLTDDLIVNERDLIGENLLALGGNQQFPEHERDERPKVRRPRPKKRTLTIALIWILIAGALAIFYFGVPVGYRINVQASNASQNTERGLTKFDTPAAAMLVDRAPEPAAARAKANPLEHAVESVNARNKWSVQISAAPARDIADTLVQRLEADGYAGYVVPAEVNGKPFFRVRIGPFDGREEAELARQSVAQQERYRDAYLIRE